MPIFAAYGMNYSDDSRAGDPFLGYYSGEREDVIDWICLQNPRFREELARQYGAKLRIIEPKVVTRKEIDEARAALDAKRDADQRVASAFGVAR